MTEDEIILMAQQAHFNSKTSIDIYNEGITSGDVRGYLQAFAHLVATKALREHAMREVQRLGQEIEQPKVRTGDCLLVGVCASEGHKIAPQRTWVGLTDEDRKQIARKANYHWEMTTSEYAERIGELTESKLKERNT